MLLSDALESAPFPDSSAAAGAAAAAAPGGGPIDFLAGGIEGAIKFLASTLNDAGIKDAFGPSIILFTLFIKLITFPLNYQQISSTTKMTALQPRTKQIQAQYKDDPSTMNMMLSQLYQENDVNPLAGCFPALAQIPIFISLYRALLNLAKENALDEPFLWLPNLEGPTYGAQNSDWLFKFENWNDFTPPLGWPSTLAFLSLPILLIVSQKASMKLLQPPAPAEGQTDQMATTNAVLEYLPFMVGFFALNVPSGLAIYWVINNLFSTGSTLLIRNSVTGGVSDSMGGGAGSFQEMMAQSTTAPPAAAAPPPAAAPIIDVQATAAADAEFAAQTAGQVAAAAPPPAVKAVAADQSKTAAKKAQKAKGKAGKKRKS